MSRLGDVSPIVVRDLLDNDRIGFILNGTAIMGDHTDLFEGSGISTNASAPSSRLAYQNLVRQAWLETLRYFVVFDLVLGFVQNDFRGGILLATGELLFDNRLNLNGLLVVLVERIEFIFYVEFEGTFPLDFHRFSRYQIVGKGLE